MTMRFAARDLELLNSDAPARLIVHDMVFHVTRASIKVAGVLHGVATGCPPEAGFILARVKRALALLTEALGGMDQVAASGKMLPEQIASYRTELLEIRSDTLDLMDRIRRTSQPARQQRLMDHHRTIRRSKCGLGWHLQL